VHVKSQVAASFDMLSRPFCFLLLLLSLLPLLKAGIYMEYPFVPQKYFFLQKKSLKRPGTLLRSFAA
jgi:hypothetical protein